MYFSSREEKEKYVQSLFSRIAECYDLINKLISFNQDDGWRKKAVQKTGLLPGSSVLDCCCGTGAMSVELFPLAGEDGTVVGLDFCEEMLSLAKQKCRGGHFIKGNVLDLPFPDNTFEAAIMGFALRNLADPVRAVQEMVRVVAPGGMVVILELNRPGIPVFRQLFGLYFNYLVPFIGSRVSGFQDPYSYLPRSYSFLPSPVEIMDYLREAGAKDVGLQPMTGGVVALYWGSV